MDTGDRLRVGLVGSTDLFGRGAARAEDAEGKPTQSDISPSILVYKDSNVVIQGGRTLIMGSA